MKVPTNWTPAQATLVIGLLEELCSSLWREYGDAIDNTQMPWEWLHRDPQPPPHTEPPNVPPVDDDLPW